MSKHDNRHPKKGAIRRAAKSGGANTTDSNERGKKKHPIDIECDLPNQLGNTPPTPMCMVTMLVLVVLAFIALHQWGIDDSVTLSLLSPFVVAVRPERH